MIRTLLGGGAPKALAARLAELQQALAEMAQTPAQLSELEQMAAQLAAEQVETDAHVATLLQAQNAINALALTVQDALATSLAQRAQLRADLDLLSTTVMMWQMAEAVPGPIGKDGPSAYQVAVAAGFTGTVEAWLASLVGPRGEGGKGGDPGPAGASAYQVALASGFSGTPAQWLASLVGAPGKNGAALSAVTVASGVGQTSLALAAGAYTDVVCTLSTTMPTTTYNAAAIVISGPLLGKSSATVIDKTRTQVTVRCTNTGLTAVLAAASVVLVDAAAPV